MTDITLINVQRFDLNLLVVLHAVIAEGSVTRAARRLSMTQPAVSNALRRARVVFKDDLFIKAPNGVRPTERALAIWTDLDASLRCLGELTRTPNFSPASTALTFRVAITDSLVAAVVAPLTRRLHAEAPQAKLHFQIHTNTGSIQGLEQGPLDCAIGMFPNPPATLSMKALLHDEYICASRSDHPWLGILTPDAFTTFQHVLVKQAPQSRGFVDIWLELNGRTRPISVIVNRFEDALHLAATTDMLAAVPRRFALAQRHPNVAIARLPFKAEPLIYKMLWHERADKSAPQIWLRGIVQDVVAEQFAKAAA